MRFTQDPYHILRQRIAGGFSLFSDLFRCTSTPAISTLLDHSIAYAVLTALVPIIGGKYSAEQPYTIIVASCVSFTT